MMISIPISIEECIIVCWLSATLVPTSCCFLQLEDATHRADNRPRKRGGVRGGEGIFIYKINPYLSIAYNN
jgi:hypothetical protein